ncbi:MAG: hypothetical protein F2793_07975 [Actinobacteria bacterium]|uniref:Unannotated protein n=1 Tax=freshwater metagenome TaxID=449393 RepID=A0A6J7EKA3_9ZZZZ|nr:hypothetical protein [Actinomycetota bacterium]
MTIIFVLVALGVIAAVGLAAAGRLGGATQAIPDRRPDTLDGEPAFDVVLRGYRMDEVDATIADLRRRLGEATPSATE